MTSYHVYIPCIYIYIPCTCKIDEQRVPIRWEPPSLRIVLTCSHNASRQSCLSDFLFSISCILWICVISWKCKGCSEMQWVNSYGTNPKRGVWNVSKLHTGHTITPPAQVVHPLHFRTSPCNRSSSLRFAFRLWYEKVFVKAHLHQSFYQNWFQSLHSPWISFFCTSHLVILSWWNWVLQCRTVHFCIFHHCMWNIK